MGRNQKMIKETTCRECGRKQWRNSWFCSDKCEAKFKENAKKATIGKLQQMAQAENLSYGQFVEKYGL